MIGISEIYFITSNDHKVKEANRILSQFNIHLKKLNIKERFKKLCYYTIPSLITTFLILLIFSFFYTPLKRSVLILFLTYLFLILSESIIKGKRHFLILSSGAILTHLFYYLGFIYGILKKK